MSSSLKEVNAGDTLKKIIGIVVIVLIGFTFALQTQFWKDDSTSSDIPSEETWNNTYGTRGWDGLNSIIETSGGEYVLAGYSNSKAWILKTDNLGNEVWSRYYFGEGIKDDKAVSLIETDDGGYAIAGQTYVPGDSNTDSWLMKVDVTGEKVWEKSYSTEDRDKVWSLVQTGDGGYVFAGQKEVKGNGGIDAWLVRTDSKGNELWSNTYGGPDYDISVWDEAWSVIQTEDGGFVLCGQKQNPDKGDVDAWLFKTDSSGRKVWSKTYDLQGWDEAWQVVQTSDGGFALAGQTHFFEEGIIDSWLLKTDKSGNQLWIRDYGTEGWEKIWSLVQTQDDGFAMAGQKQYLDNDIVEAWVLRTDDSGKELWSKTFRGSHYGSEVWDKVQMIIQTNDGGFGIVGGTSTTDNNRLDGWFIKTDEDGSGL